VVVQLRTGQELFTAHIANKHLDSNVDLFVIAYRAELEEALVADRAGVGAISTMAAAMCRQIRIHQKAFSADVADKWTLVGIV